MAGPSGLVVPSLSTVASSTQLSGDDRVSSTPRGSPPSLFGDQEPPSSPLASSSSSPTPAVAAGGEQRMYPCLLDLSKLPSSSTDVSYRDERFLPPRDETPSPPGPPDVPRALLGALPSLESLSATVSRKLSAMPLTASASFASSSSYPRLQTSMKEEFDDENPFMDQVSEKGTSSSSVASEPTPRPLSFRGRSTTHKHVPSRTVSQPLGYAPVSPTLHVCPCSVSL